MHAFSKCTIISQYDSLVIELGLEDLIESLITHILNKVSHCE
jgi:hypothetical protein